MSSGSRSARPPPPCACSNPSARRANSPLPDPDALLWREVQLVGRAGRVRVVPSVEVTHHRAAELRGAVRIGDEPVRELLVAIQTTPHLRPAEEESLLAGKAVDH